VASKRARIVYQLTADGKEHLQQVLASSGPAAWEDENFDVRFAFFGQTDAVSSSMRWARSIFFRVG